MAFLASGLRKLLPMGIIGNGANSVKSCWAYVTADAAATVEAASYFNAAASQLSVGDAIMVTSGIGGTQKLKWMSVTAISAVNVVTVALQTTTAG